MGVFIAEGMGLRIPVGGLSIGVDDSGGFTSNLTLEVRLDIWPYWLDIGMDHAVEALSTRQGLIEAAQGPDETKSSLLEAECKTGMVAIAAAAFALDAFYEATRNALPGMDALVATWNKSGTARHARVSETLRRAFRVNDQQVAKLRQQVKELFKFRAWAVHPPAGYREPVLHDVLRVGVEWRFVAFSATNARRAIVGATNTIAQCLGAPRSQDQGFRSWCESALVRVGPRIERSKVELGE